jgi:2-(1,2-epoxy-1,2-dihydrophenyl)acetyl-CoA isomerase
MGGTASRRRTVTTSPREPVRNCPVRLHRDGAVVEIRFHRPDRLNAIDAEMADAFVDAVNEALAHEDVRVIVLSGDGRSFMAGGDLAWFDAKADASGGAWRLIDPMHTAISKLCDSPAITIAAVQGAVAGGGMSLALAADLLIAADDAVFDMAYARIGATPDCSGTWHLPRIVGLRKALEIALLTPKLDTAEAQRLSLVNWVVSTATLREEAWDLARRLAGGPAQALGETKALLRAASQRDLEDQMEREGEAFVRASRSADFRNALGAFRRRREPTTARD